MAIQFNCPYCTTQIRVPDSAGGKRGNCPRCKAKILVPKVAVAAGEPAAVEPAAPAETGKTSKRQKRKAIRERLAAAPQFDELPETELSALLPAVPETASPPPLHPSPMAESGGVPPLPVTAAIPAAARENATPFARALKRRRRRRRYTWVPVVCGLLLVGGAAVFFIVTGRKQLAGTLQAVIVPEANLPPRTIGGSLLPVDSDKSAKVLKYLQKEPLGVLRSDLGLMKHEVTATDTGLTVAVYETEKVRFFRVDIRKDKTLRDYLSDHATSFDRPREQELNSGLKEFFSSAADAVAAGGSIPNEALGILRSRVIVNSLVGAAGYHLHANVDGQLYLCMYEDDSGRLYYLLPRDTKKFTLVGRKLADGTKMFTGKYTVDVEGTLESKTDKTAEEPEPPAKTGKSAEPAGK